MSSYGLTENGFIKPAASEIQTEIENSFKTEYGELIDLSPGSFFGNLAGITAEREALLWELAEALYFSTFPATAQGVNLDNASALTGITRLNEKFSTETVTLGTAGGSPVNVPAGSLVSQSATGQTWQTLVDVIIPAAGTVDVLSEATEPGPIDAPAASIDTIVTVITGLDTVTNAGNTTLGRLEETDSELRTRRSQSIILSKGGTGRAIANRLLNDVEGVSFVSWQENRTSLTDANGLLPHSFLFTVIGGTDQDIANMIFWSKPVGINTNGTTAVVVTDEFEIEHIIKFNRANFIDIYYIIDIEINENYPDNGNDLIKNALIAYGDSLKNGETVKYWQSIAAIDNNGNIPGIENLTLFLGTSPAPTGQVNISIDINDIGRIQAANITVNQV